MFSIRQEFFGKIVKKSDLEVFRKIFLSFERNEKYVTQFSYQTNTGKEYESSCFDDFISYCYSEKDIKEIKYSLFDYTESASRRIYIISFDFSPHFGFNRSKYSIVCEDKNQYSSFLKQIEETLSKCDKYNPVIFFLYLKYFLPICIGGLISSYFSYISKLNNFGKIPLFMSLFFSILILCRYVTGYLFPDCENDINANQSRKKWKKSIKLAVVWLFVLIAGAAILKFLNL